ncbi:hypothetical protein ACFSZS_19370 [Seohaeicola zhoushanensis]
MAGLVDPGSDRLPPCDLCGHLVDTAIARDRDAILVGDHVERARGQAVVGHQHRARRILHLAAQVEGDVGKGHPRGQRHGQGADHLGHSVGEVDRQRRILP